jgi:hypothetical protein
VDLQLGMRAFDEEPDPEGPAKDDNRGRETLFARNGATWSSSTGDSLVVTYMSESNDGPGSEHLFFPLTFSLSSTGLTAPCQLRISSGCGADLVLGAHLELSTVPIISVSVMPESMLSILQS